MTPVTVDEHAAPIAEQLPDEDEPFVHELEILAARPGVVELCLAECKQQGVRRPTFGVDPRCVAGVAVERRIYVSKVDLTPEVL